jgi:hypothetical protein
MVSTPSKYRMASASGARATEAWNISSIVPYSAVMSAGIPSP